MYRIIYNEEKVNLVILGNFKRGVVLMVLQRIYDFKWLFMALVILSGNLIVYQLSFIYTLPPEQINGMVLGSLIDCAIIAPALLLLQKGKWSVKNFIAFVAMGIIFARLVIPTAFIEPFRYVMWSAIAVEAALIIVELTIIFIFIKYFPSIIRAVKLEQEQLIFSFPRITAEKMKNNFLIKILCSEILVFYYAFCSWRKKQSNGFTVYKNTMYVPFLVMIFHAALFEAVAFHWYFHDRMPILAWGHTILSIYGLLFLLADFRALSLNPVKIVDGKIYISNGLMKRTKIDLTNIVHIHTTVQDETIYHLKVMGNTDELPAFVIETNQQQIIHTIGGLQKTAKYIGVYADDPSNLRREIELAMK